MIRARLLTVALALLLVGCGGRPATSVGYAPGVDFTAYRSFHLIPCRQAERPAARDEAESLVAAKLRAAGYRQVEAGGDFAVGVLLDVVGRLEVEDHGYAYGFGLDLPATAGEAGLAVREFEEASLVVDIVDPARREVGWRGTATGRVQGALRRSARLEAAVEAILADFPPTTQSDR